MVDLRTHTSRLQLEASWAGVFYDLAFVAGIVVLSSAYARDYSASMVLWLIVVFAMLWTAWLASTAVLARRGEPVGVLTLLALLGQMLAVLVLAVAADDSISDLTDVVGRPMRWSW